MLKYIFVFFVHSFSVESSILWVTTFTGQRSYAAILKKICWRESRCRRLGTHSIDQKFSKSVWNKMVRRGILRPESCPFHRNPYEWSTSGPYGLMRAYHWPYIGSLCLPPQVLDIPLVATWVALKKLLQHCQSLCTYQQSRKIWKGKHYASH